MPLYAHPPNRPAATTTTDQRPFLRVLMLDALALMSFSFEKYGRALQTNSHGQRAFNPDVVGHHRLPRGGES